ncbi:MAG: 5-formyltetrahydrofolate cyclo-ligase [Phycisphaerales bacterium]|nr:5-formyltetrahydrofolate cyclo-ligase [Phycisphaerales bacterium]
MSKAALRATLRAALANVDSEKRVVLSAAICARAIAQSEYASASVIMAFLSLPDEVDTGDLIGAALRAGKRVAAPCADWDSKTMRVAPLTSVDRVVETGRHGLREPIAGSVGASIPLGDIDLVIVPGLGFDESGARLGRAAGFYDRFLAQPELRAKRMALALDRQIVERLPTEPHDQPVDLIVTESRVIRPA